MISYSGAAAIMFFVGSALSYVLDVPSRIIPALISLFIVVPFLFCIVTLLAKKKEVFILAVVPAFLLAGFLITDFKTDETRRQLYPFAGEEVKISGRICSLPVNYDDTTQFLIRVSQIEHMGHITKANEKIKVSTSDVVPPVGTGVVFSGKLKLISPAKNSTSFDTKGYNMRRNIFFSAYTEQLYKNNQLPKLSATDRAGLFVRESMDIFIDRFPRDAVPLLKGIVLNNKGEIPDEITENMLRTGTYRYIYSPFIHISLIIFFLERIFGSRRSGIFAGICIFMLYLCMNMTVASAWKICLFFGFSYVLMAFLRIRDFKTSLYLAVLFTGIISPLTLTEPGFVISVTATVLIRCFSRDVSRMVYTVVHNRRLASFLSIYLIIMIGIYPVSSLYGYGLTPYSFIAGLVITPLTMIIYVLFYISFGIYMLCGAVFDWAIAWLVRMIMHISEFVAVLPFSSYNTGSVGVVFAAFFYITLYCVYRRLRYCKNLMCEILACVLGIVFIAGLVSGINDIELTFLSVGNADCAVITLPGRKTVMIDGGGSEAYSDYDMGRAEVIPYLKAKGINKIDTIILSHFDKDHADGVVAVLETMPVKEIFVPDYLPNNYYRDIIEDEALKRNTTINYISSPCVRTLADTLKCEFLHTADGEDENENSLVARITYGETSMLFAGDIGKFTEYSLTDTRADILKIPHHGSKNSNSELFIKRTSPVYSVACVGENNTYGHPAPEVVERYIKNGSVLLRTDTAGDIHFVIDKNRIKRVYSFREWFINGKKS